MSENALIPQELLNQTSTYGDSTALEKVSKSSDYLPRIDLLTGNNRFVQDGVASIGDWALMRDKDNYDEMGRSWVGLLVSWRPVAMRFQPEFEAQYNPDSDEFKSIEAQALGGTGLTGAAFGPQYLVWLPEFDTLATWFLGNKTGRNESKNIIPLLPSEGGTGLINVETQMLSNKKNRWPGPKVSAVELSIETPPWNDLMDDVNKFNNPKEGEAPEKAETSDDDR